MTRFYKRPILLIEFDPDKSFSLQVSGPEGAVTLGIFTRSFLYVTIRRNGFYFVLSFLEQNASLQDMLMSVLVSRGRAPFGQHQESRPLAIPVLNGFVNTID